MMFDEEKMTAGRCQALVSPRFDTCKTSGSIVNDGQEALVVEDGYEQWSLRQHQPVTLTNQP